MNYKRAEKSMIVNIIFSGLLIASLTFAVKAQNEMSPDEANSFIIEDIHQDDDASPAFDKYDVFQSEPAKSLRVMLIPEVSVRTRDSHFAPESSEGESLPTYLGRLHHAICEKVRDKPYKYGLHCREVFHIPYKSQSRRGNAISENLDEDDTWGKRNRNGHIAKASKRSRLSINGPLSSLAGMLSNQARRHQNAEHRLAMLQQRIMSIGRK